MAKAEQSFVNLGIIFEGKFSLEGKARWRIREGGMWEEIQVAMDMWRYFKDQK